MRTDQPIHAALPWPTRSTALADLLAPPLPDCACRGEHDVFDNARIDVLAREVALNICAGCSCRPQCAAWSATLPQRQRVALGVVGGAIVPVHNPPATKQPVMPTGPAPVPRQRPSSRIVGDSAGEAAQRAQRTAIRRAARAARRRVAS